MLAEEIGEMLAKFRVKYAFFGHSHSSTVEIRRFWQVGSVQAYNVAYSKTIPYLVAEL